MPVQIVPLAAEHLSAVRAFNLRMTENKADTDFLLPESIEPPPTPENGPIEWQQYLAIEGSEVRGGVLEMNQPGWLNRRPVRAVNFQSPLSESLIDRSKAMVGVQMLRFMQSRSEAVFALGMGSSETAWPRLLKGAGWSLRPIPFLFRVHRAARFLRGLPMLHARRSRSLASHVAAATGAGALALAFKQRRIAAADLVAVPQHAWGSWADEIWERFREECSFTVQRDREMLRTLYNENDHRLHILLIEGAPRAAGWAVCLDTQMKNHRHFGDLRVGSVLDCAASAADMPRVAVAIDRYLRSRGVDLVVLNHSHNKWVTAFRSAGFLSGPSNYMLGMSKALTAALRTRPDGEALVHITRGDGDGRNNLM